MLAPPLRGLEGLQMRLALQSMGLKDVKLDLDCTSTEDRAKGELALDRCALVGPGLGEIDLSGRIVDADPPLWRVIDDGDFLTFEGETGGEGGTGGGLADSALAGGDDDDFCHGNAVLGCRKVRS